MRKFFKSLAVLLALTLVVGVIPAAAADSLSMQKEKILYLGGSQGTKEDGTKCKTGAKKLVANMIKGFDKDTMSVDLKSADDSIVKASNKTGKITAKSLGTTTVTVKVYDADETELLNQELKVKVKKNAADVTVTGIADGDKFSVGQEVPVTLPRQGVDTDERELTVDNAEIADLKVGEKARTYTVKFLKAGEVTFTAKAYQSAKYPKATQSKTIKVTVTNPVPSDVKVVASNAYELIFDEDVEALGLFKDKKEIANDACYYMLNETKVTHSAVESIKTTKNVVRVNMYDNFIDGTTYYVVINGSEPIPFVVAGSKPKDVDSIAILSDTVVAGEASKIKIALYNKDGIDITKAVEDAAGNRITLSSTNLSSYPDSGERTLTMSNVGDKTALTATYVWADPNNNYEELKKETTKEILAVAASSDVFSKLVYTVDNKNDTISENYTTKNYIAVGDPAYNFKALFVCTNNGTTKKFVVGSGAATDQFNGHNLEAKIPEEATALLGTYAAGVAGGSYPITANQEGSTNVFIGYYDNNNKWVTVAVAPIEVKPARYPATLDAKVSQSTLNNTDLSPKANDKLRIEVVVKDQYGDGVALNPATNLELTQNSDSEKVAKLNDRAFQNGNNTGEYYIEVNQGDVAYNGTDAKSVVVTAKVVNLSTSKANTKTVSFSVKAAGTQPLDYKNQNVLFKNNGEASLDTTITGFTQLKAASLQVSTEANNYFTGNVGLTWANNYPTMQSVATGGGVYFVLTVKKNGTFVTANDNFLNVNTTNGSITLKNFYVDGASVVSKLDKGSYEFKVFKVESHATDPKKNVINPPKTIVINVSDNQAPPVFKQIAETSATPSAPYDCFTFAFGDKNDYQNAPEVSYAGNVSAASGATSAVYVKKADIKVQFTMNDTTVSPQTYNTDYITLSCNIGKLIKDANP